MVAAAAELGPGVRVVSVPSFFRFDRQDAAYRESVLPASCTKRISLEAGVTLGWDRYTLNHDNCLGIDRFGASAPGPTVMEKFGITSAAVVAHAKKLLG